MAENGLTKDSNGLSDHSANDDSKEPSCGVLSVEQDNFLLTSPTGAGAMRMGAATLGRTEDNSGAPDLAAVDDPQSEVSSIDAPMVEAENQLMHNGLCTDFLFWIGGLELGASFLDANVCLPQCR